MFVGRGKSLSRGFASTADEFVREEIGGVSPGWIRYRLTVMPDRLQSTDKGARTSRVAEDITVSLYRLIAITITMPLSTNY